MCYGFNLMFGNVTHIPDERLATLNMIIVITLDLITINWWTMYCRTS